MLDVAVAVIAAMLSSVRAIRLRPDICDHLSVQVSVAQTFCAANAGAARTGLHSSIGTLAGLAPRCVYRCGSAVESGFSSLATKP